MPRIFYKLTAASRAGTAFSAAQLHFGVDYESGVAEVNTERAALFVKFFV